MWQFFWDFYYWITGQEEDDFITEQVEELRPLVEEFVPTPFKPPKFVPLSPAFKSPLRSPRLRYRKKRKVYFPDILEEDYIS